MTIAERIKELKDKYNSAEPYIPADERGILITEEKMSNPDKLPVFITYTFNGDYNYQPNRNRFYKIH